jgi:hypothetical protein
MNFYQALVSGHSIIRWIFLLLLIFSLSVALYKWVHKTGLSASDKKVSRITMIIAHVQLLTGITLYFVSPKVVFSEFTMSVSMLRFYAMEHALLMIISITLITIGFIKVKHTGDPVIAAKKIFLWYLPAFILILIAIPWPFRNFGTNWF